jgi:hypothetical protein
MNAMRKRQDMPGMDNIYLSLLIYVWCCDIGLDPRTTSRELPRIPNHKQTH